MQIVIAGDVAVVVPEGASTWDVASWINPGLLPDEYTVLEPVFVSLAEVSAQEWES